MAQPAKGPPDELLRAVLNYDPETGVFTRAVRCGPVMAGEVAGGQRPDGYNSISVGARRYLAHRLAWQYVTGVSPTLEIDHINGDKADNRFGNLRHVSREVNQQNWRKVSKRKWHSSYLGVSWRGDCGRWVAQITSKRKTYNLGLYDTEEEAHAAYLTAKRKLHVGCTI